MSQIRENEESFEINVNQKLKENKSSFILNFLDWLIKRLIKNSILVYFIYFVFTFRLIERLLKLLNLLNIVF
jgi:hypothetical protein